jgi:hypothetical protein
MEVRHLADSFWTEQLAEQLMRDVGRDKDRDHDAAWLWYQLENLSSDERVELVTLLDAFSEAQMFLWRDEERPQIARAIQYLRDWRAKYDG